MCVDRDSYVSSIYNYSAEASHAAFPDSSGYADGVTCDGFDVEKAKQILADAGYADNDGDGVLEKDGKKLTKNEREAEIARLEKEMKQDGLDMIFFMLTGYLGYPPAAGGVGYKVYSQCCGRKKYYCKEGRYFSIFY